MKNDDKKRVLVCPLNWGLGHASRMIPIIELLQNAGCEVIIAADNPQRMLITYRFTGIKTIFFPSFRVKFSKRKKQLLPILGIALRFLFYTIKEHYLVKRLVKECKIDFIVSDNRYGLWCKGIKSVLITHQLRVLFPKPFRFLEPLGVMITCFLANKHSFCWIPDFEGEENLAGKLSHPYKLPMNTKYIGLLSRFQNSIVNREAQDWDLVGIASGPSPQREIFIDIISKLSKYNKFKTLIIKGNPEEGTKIYADKNLFCVGHLNDIEFANAILSTNYLITRSGYSTIMDLVTLGVSGLIVPTPGQTEQEYLADYLSKKGIFKACNQHELEFIDISIAKVTKSLPFKSENYFVLSLIKELVFA